MSLIVTVCVFSVVIAILIYAFIQPSQIEIEREQKKRIEKEAVRKEQEATINGTLEKINSFLNLPSLNENNISALDLNSFTSYIELILSWQSYEKVGGTKHLSHFLMPIEHQLFQKIYTLVNKYKKNSANPQAISELTFDDLQGAEVIGELYVEYGLPKGFELGSLLFFSFLNGKCRFISETGEVFQINAPDISKTLMSTHRDKVKLKMSIRNKVGDIEVIIYSKAGENYDKSIARIDQVNKGIMEQKSIAQKRPSLSNLNPVTLKENFTKVQDLTNKKEQLITIHALLEKSLKDLLNNQHLSLVELLNKASHLGIINNIDNIHNARKTRNNLAHNGNISENECEVSLKAYEQSLISIVNYLNIKT